MDNQQGKKNELKLAWLGGFIDGEGSICMMTTNNGRLHKDGTPITNKVPRITVANTHKETLDMIVGILDEVNLPYHISWRYPTNKRWKESWHLSVQGMKRFLKWADVIEPYVFLKKEHFRIAREYCESRLSHWRQDPLTDSEMEAMARFTTRESPQRLNALKK